MNLLIGLAVVIGGFSLMTLVCCLFNYMAGYRGKRYVFSLGLSDSILVTKLIVYAGIIGFVLSQIGSCFSSLW